MCRDFTYINDIDEGITRLLLIPPSDEQFPMNLFNIGNNKPEKLADFTKEIENTTQKTAIKEYLPMQAGEVEKTYDDVQSLIDYIDYRPNTSIHVGVRNFVKWYKNYYKI
jgi:UDP-glucuronate 4-epimerase